MKKLLSLVLAVGLIFSIVTSVFANSSVDQNITQMTGRNVSLDELPEKERNLLLERAEIVEAYIMEIEEAHANLRRLRNQQLQATDSSKRNELSALLVDAENKLTEARNNTEKYGLVKLEPDVGQSEIQPLSVAGNFTITENYILWDSAVGKYLYHTAGNWNNTNWANDYSCVICTSGWKNVGGTDGYYLASLHQQINTYNPKFFTLNWSDWSISHDWSDVASTYSTGYGFGWEFQDQIKISAGPIAQDYNADRQLGWFWFDFVNGVPTGQTISFKVDVGHSWSSTSLNSIGLGPWSFSFSWTSDNNRWNKDQTYTKTF